MGRSPGPSGNQPLTEQLRITLSDEAVLLEGEVDVASADAFYRELGDAIEQGITTVDVSGVTFMDSTGLRVILASARTLDKYGRGPLRIRRVTPPVRRLFDVALPGGAPELDLDAQ